KPGQFGGAGQRARHGRRLRRIRGSRRHGSRAGRLDRRRCDSAIPAGAGPSQCDARMPGTTGLLEGPSMNQIKLALLAAIASLFLASYAVALESREAAIVADVLETLASERGEPVYYDEEAADDWYEFDADGDGLIPAAGFTRESWQVAYEQTLKGLVALTPQSEFDAMFGNVEEKVAALQ